MMTPSRFSPYIEVSEASLRHNVARIKELAQSSGACRLVMAVVKADAYGHGIAITVPILNDAGVDGFAVYHMREAVTIRELGITKPILLLGPAHPGEVELLLRYDVRLWLDSLEVAHALAAEARRQNTVARVHLSINTGLNREGVSVEDVSAVARELYALEPHLRVEGMGTHFIAAESKDFDEATEKQHSLFSEAVNEARAEGLTPSILHASNGAGALRHPKACFDMLRVGSLCYGVELDDVKDPQWKQVGSLRVPVASLRRIRKGESIGYGSTYTATVDSKALLLAVGYADGLSRHAAGALPVLIGSKPYEGIVAGKVSMNTTMVVTSIDTPVELGDIVTIIGGAGEVFLSASQYASVVPGLRVPHVFTQFHAESVNRILVS